MAPSYINIKCLRCPSSLLPFQPPKLILQQFTNVHDVSWGTKGDNVVDLSTVSTVTSGEVVAAVTDEKDMNEVYKDMLHVLQTKKLKEVKKVDDSQQQQDYYRTK